MPTEEQLESRKQVGEFLRKVSAPVSRAVSAITNSAWFGRPPEELEGWVERGRAIKEIEDSMGYRLIMSQTQKEIEWAREQLELGKLDGAELRMYLRSLRFLKDFIITTERNADISSSVLAGRPTAIGEDTSTFVKNARTDDASNG